MSNVVTSKWKCLRGFGVMILVWRERRAEDLCNRCACLLCSKFWCAGKTDGLTDTTKPPPEHTRWEICWGKNKMKQDYPRKWQRNLKSKFIKVRLQAESLSSSGLAFCRLKWGRMKAGVDRSVCFLMIRMNLPLTRVSRYCTVYQMFPAYLIQERLEVTALSS